MLLLLLCRLLLLLLCLLLLLLRRLLLGTRVYMMELILLMLLSLMCLLLDLMCLMRLMSRVGGMSLMCLLVLGISRVMRLLLLLRVVLLSRLLGLLGLLVLLLLNRLLLLLLMLLNRLLGLLLLMVLLLLLLRVTRMPTQCLLRRMLLMLLLRMVLRMVLLVREDGVVGDGLGHGAREEHRRRVRLRLDLLARRSGALARYVDGIGHMDVWRPRRGARDSCVDGRGRVEEVLVLGIRARRLLRIGLRLVRRGGLGRRRLLVRLVCVRRGEGRAASVEGGLRETQAMRVGPGRAQAGHDGAGDAASSSTRRRGGSISTSSSQSREHANRTIAPSGGGRA